MKPGGLLLLRCIAAGVWGLSTPGNAAGDSPTGAPADWPRPMMGDQPVGMVLLDRLEYGDDEHWLWDAQAWYGGDRHKLWLKTEGAGPAGNRLDEAEVQVLYAGLMSPFWNWQAGLRRDIRPAAEDVTYAVAGLQGLAPQWFETDVALFVSDEGHLSLRGEFEYDLLFSQRLVLQTRLEFTASASDVPESTLGSGLATSAFGLRLRYELRRQFAPYVGVRWERRYGETRDLARAAGEPVSSTAWVAGLRAWF
jgi:copper resistance protein B